MKKADLTIPNIVLKFILTRSPLYRFLLKKQKRKYSFWLPTWENIELKQVMEIGLLLMGLINFVQTYHSSFFHLLQDHRCTNKSKIHRSCGRSHSHDRVVKSGTRLYLNCKKIINEATTTTTKSKHSGKQKNNYYEGSVRLLEYMYFFTN